MSTRTALIAALGALPLCMLSPMLLAMDPSSDMPDTLVDRCWQRTFNDDFDRLSLRREESASPEPSDLPAEKNGHLQKDGQHEQEALLDQTDSGTWTTRYIWPRDVIINAEKQYYVDPGEHGLSPYRVDSGVLSIVATRTPEALKRAAEGQPFVSGVLTTEKSFAQRHGRFEVRARVPEGRGLWSAFWLLPSFDQWPEGVDILPEIDVMEHLGHERETYHTTLHTNQSGELESFPYEQPTDSDLTAGFHLYSVVWTEDAVAWYLDGRRRATHPTPRDFTRPVHLLLNLAVGGSWPGSPDEETEFPARYQIDRVTVYKADPDCE